MYEYYQSTEEFIEAFNGGTFNGEVVIENDKVTAYRDGEEVFDFGRKNPEGALFDILEALGINVKFA